MFLKTYKFVYMDLKSGDELMWRKEVCTNLLGRLSNIFKWYKGFGPTDLRILYDAKFLEGREFMRITLLLCFY